MALGDKPKSLEFLEKRFCERSGLQAGFGWVSVMPMFDELRSDRRFLSLLKAMNLPVES